VSDKGTEKASPERVRKAKEKGDVVRSRDLLSATALMAGVLALGAMSQQMVTSWGRVFVECLRIARVDQLGSENLWRVGFRQMLGSAVLPIGLMMAASFATALGVGIAQGGGLSIHPNALELKFDRFNPVTNLGNLFSLRSATRVMKSLVPAAVMVVFGWYALKALMVPLPVMSLVRLPGAFDTAYSLLLKAAWVTLIWSALDYSIEWRARAKRLKATKQEVRQEVKEAMGNPEIKSKIRQIQRAMRRRRMKADLSKASVVVTNPTHYAVALEFSFDTMQAPTVLAKGRDLHAAEIREEARWAGIPIVENPPLARSLYKMVEPGQSIPFDLYAAVAGILAFLYRQKVEEKMRADRARAERAAEAQAEARRRLPLPVPVGFGAGGGL
jgi:flagellar biosynthetic protein FlhB